MRYYLLVLLFLGMGNTIFAQNNIDFNKFLKDYYEEGLKLQPLFATFNGDNRYNDQMPVDFTESYRTKMAEYYARNLKGLSKFNRASMNENDQLSYDVLLWRLQLALEGLKFKDNRIPFSQFNGAHLSLAQLGSG